MLLKKLWVAIKWVLSKLRQLLSMQDFWFVFVPTAAMAIIMLVEFSGTKDQLSLLREQMSTIRRPVIRVYTRPNEISKFPYFKNKLIMSNLGNDTAMSILARFGLFIINDTSIFSFGPMDEVFSSVGNADKRTARQNVYPRLNLKPNGEICLDTFGFYPSLGYLAYQYPLDTLDAPLKDFYNLKELLNGSFILFIDCSYRRPYDFMAMADTFYFEYEPNFGPMNEIQTVTGGVGALKRLKNYLEEGPENLIFIKNDYYYIWGSALNHPNTGGKEVIIPRVLKTKS